MQREGLNLADMAARVQTSRQNITNVLHGAERPKCLPDLARVMNTTVDVLMAGQYHYDTPMPSGGKAQRAAWPFERLTQHAWERLSERQKGAIEDAAVLKLREIEAGGGKVPAAPMSVDPALLAMLQRVRVDRIKGPDQLRAVEALLDQAVTMAVSGPADPPTPAPTPAPRTARKPTRQLGPRR